MAKRATVADRPRTPRWLRPTIVGVLLAVAFYQMSGWLFHNLKGFLGLLFLAWLFSITIEPIVDRLERFGMRRGAGTGLVLFSLIALTIGFFAVFGTLLFDQIAQLLTTLPDALTRITDWANRTFDTNFKTGDELFKITPDTVRDLAQRFTPGVLASSALWSVPCSRS